MRKLLLIIIPLLVAIAVFSIFALFLNYNSSVGALQVTANPKSIVSLNGKQVGQTPLCKCNASEMLKTGEYTVKIVPAEGGYEPFEAKVPIGKGVLTVVDRSFSRIHSPEGSIITLTPIDDKKTAEILVLSSPEETTVVLNSSSTGTAPYLVKNVTESDHELRVTKPGYRDKIIRIHTVVGYRVTVTAFLGVLQGNETPIPLATLIPSPTASPSASLKPVQQVTILSTPIGYLRVRKEPTVNSAEIAQVNPGETYEMLTEQEGWVQIRLKNGTDGWVTAQYISKSSMLQ